MNNIKKTVSFLLLILIAMMQGCYFIPIRSVDLIGTWRVDNNDKNDLRRIEVLGNGEFCAKNFTLVEEEIIVRGQSVGTIKCGKWSLDSREAQFIRFRYPTNSNNMRGDELYVDRRVTSTFYLIYDSTEDDYLRFSKEEN